MSELFETEKEAENLLPNYKQYNGKTIYFEETGQKHTIIDSTVKPKDGKYIIAVNLSDPSGGGGLTVDHVSFDSREVLE